MNRLSYFSLFFIVLLGFSACGNKDNSTPNYQTMIVGKWNLQREVYVQYINNAKQVDTTCIAADTVYSNVQFNADKTFKSLSIRFSKSLNLSSPDDETNTSGTYTVSGTSFTLSESIGGIYFHSGGIVITGFPVYTNINTTAQLNKLTANSMYIHIENDYTETANNVSTDYKITNDLYYTK
jgi:hypothetical protein